MADPAPFCEAIPHWRSRGRVERYPACIGQFRRDLPGGLRGGHAGAETANHIASYMKNVTIVELQSDIAPDEVDTPRNGLMADLAKNQVRLCTETSVAEIKDHSVVLQGKINEEIPADTVVLSVGRRPNTALSEELHKAGYDVRTIGDANQVGLVGLAVREGYLVGRNI